MTATLRQKFETLEETLNDEVFERTQEIHTAVIAMLSRAHHFQVGPPGTAKSFSIDRLIKRISGLGDEGYFRWLLTNFTTPEELFGGPDFLLLREKGIYKRVTTGKLPRAYFGFADEIFKANSSILNTNLTIMNERLFFNPGEDPHVPLISLYSASNELPQGEELWALWDRLHFRHEVAPMQESTNFIAMLSANLEKNPAPIIDLEDIFAAHAAVDAVVVPVEVTETIKGLRDTLHNDGIEVTERRWNECMGIIRAEAFFNGRETADIEDMRPLMHVLWADEKNAKQVKKHVLSLANPVDKEAYDIIESFESLEYDFKEMLGDSDNTKQTAKQAIEIQKKIIKAKGKLNALREQQKISGRKSEYLDQAQRKFVDLAKRVMVDGLQMDLDE